MPKQKPQIASILNRAQRFARILQEKYPVRTEFIPEGASYHMGAEEKAFKKRTLRLIARFSHSFMDNEFRSKALNHLQFIEVSCFLFSTLAARANSAGFLSQRALRDFISAMHGIFEKQAIPYDVVVLAAGLRNGSYMPAEKLDALYSEHGLAFAEFCSALEKEALSLRHGYSERLAGRLANHSLSKREQTEHVMSHAVLLSTALCEMVGKRYARELQGETA
ncbi:MAG: hypothetical protein N3E51_05110 [Candidatus Micrarchaeota archaeon]|nr:hypothetical protein [Candidatus Micrarchaeota archaeon]